MSREEMIYLKVSEETKKAISILKELGDIDSNDVYYNVLNDSLKSQGVNVTISKDYIDQIFKNVDIEKLKKNLLISRMAKVQAELSAKLGISDADMTQYLASMNTTTEKPKPIEPETDPKIEKHGKIKA